MPLLSGLRSSQPFVILHSLLRNAERFKYRISLRGSWSLAGLTASLLTAKTWNLDLMDWTIKEAEFPPLFTSNICIRSICSLYWFALNPFSLQLKEDQDVQCLFASFMYQWWVGQKGILGRLRKVLSEGLKERRQSRL